MLQRHLSNKDQQGIRPVNKNYRYTPASTSIDPYSVSYIDIHMDPATQEPVVFWEDVLKAYKNALHIRHQAKVMPFLKDEKFQTLEPRRFAANLGVILDVVVSEQFVDSDVALSEGVSQGTLQTSCSNEIGVDNTARGARRNPTYGLEEVAMDNYRNNDNPAFHPTPRAPQLHTSERTTPSNTISNYSSNSNRPRAPQEYTVPITAATPTEMFILTMVEARFGDKDAQFAVGNMLSDGQGVHQDIQAAFDWYLKAAEQGHTIAQRNVVSLQEKLRIPPTPEDPINIKLNNDSWNDTRQGLFDQLSQAMSLGPMAVDGVSTIAQLESRTSVKHGQLATTMFSRALVQNLQAANQGDVDALNSIGNMYYNGLGVPQDLDKAHGWYEKAKTPSRLPIQDISHSDNNTTTSTRLLHKPIPRMTHTNVQALWPVSITTSPDTVAAPNPDEVFYVDIHTDLNTNKGFVFWEDIKLAFDDALHVQRQGSKIPFIEGEDSIPLSPYRLPALLGEVLEVVVNGELVDMDNSPLLEANSSTNSFAPRRNPVYGLENTAMDNYSHMDIPITFTKIYETTSQTAAQNMLTADRTHINTAANGDTASRRNPTYGLEDVAMDNYRNIDNPAFQPAPRAPQLYKSDETTAENDTAETILSDSTNQPRAPQLYTESVTPNTLTEYIQMMVEARLGDVASQVILGDMYNDARGVKHDFQAAADWYLKAAEQGNPEACRKLGIAYSGGLGVTKDYSVAMDWFREAAGRGDVLALSKIGHIYANRIDVPQDYAKELGWFKKAADQGNLDAKMYLRLVMERIADRNT
ncbi:MAG: hypothetical protein J3R72DRAFT_526204 [Linnemannia gamsii]|nr:MAG: hypothetical protein J3R72DRAFT_526204 [Linnemannia gamsii]